MSRRDGIDISAIIDQCKEYKDIYNNAKKLSEPLENQIKEYAANHPNEKLLSDKWEAKVTIKCPEEFNDEKAIEIIKENLSEDLISQVIRTQEYIDEDALEKLIYSGKFDSQLLACCKTTGKPSIRLNIVKRK